MATNQKFDRADSVSLPVPAETPAGVFVRVGALAGVTRAAEGTGGNPEGYATVDLVGAYVVPVSGALTPGQSVFMTGTPDGNGLLAGPLTATASGNTLVGASLTTKSSGSGLATVRPARI
jgi:hypothetical protein